MATTIVLVFAWLTAFVGVALGYYYLTQAVKLEPVIGGMLLFASGVAFGVLVSAR